MSLDAMTMFIVKLLDKGYTIVQANKALMRELNDD
jgi:hypothetical protein